MTLINGKTIVGKTNILQYSITFDQSLIQSSDDETPS